MTMDINCTYQNNRDETLVAYLYDDIEPAARLAFESHLARCAACRRELDELAIVRGQLGEWKPPSLDRVLSAGTPTHDRKAHVAWWKEIPAWAQAAAAVLVLGASAGVANLQISYGAQGFSVRTGWMGTASPGGVAAPGANQAAPWRADVAALEQQVRDLRAATVAQAAAARPNADADAVLRRVRTLIEQGEQRQQRELALRIAEVDTNVKAQRIADLRNIDRNFDMIQTNTGVSMRQLEMRTNDLARRVSLTR
jgi:anti-sigma factor RsiW